MKQKRWQFSTPVRVLLNNAIVLTMFTLSFTALEGARIHAITEDMANISAVVLACILVYAARKVNRGA